jgi:hypothetical protein
MKASVVVAYLVLVACSSNPSSSPPPSTTFLVTNATCVASSCVPFQLNAEGEYECSLSALYVCWGYTLGQVTTASTCLTFADSLAADPGTLDAFDSGGDLLAITSSTFVAADAPGWSVTFDTTPTPAESAVGFVGSMSQPEPMTAACTPPGSTSPTSP